MKEEDFIEKVRLGEEVNFSELMNMIAENFHYTPSSFINGDLVNNENENQGSAKLFSFAFINKLSKDEALKCFGEHYKTVLESPNGDTHYNIRSFMKSGWKGLKFEKTVLMRKKD